MAKRWRRSACLISADCRARHRNQSFRSIVLLACLSLFVARTVGAQPEDSTPNLETTLVAGQTVWITDAAGREHKTRIVGVAGGVVTTRAGEDVRQLMVADVVRVRTRLADPLVNGAIVGAGTAIASGLFLCSLTETWENCRDDVGPMLRIGALGAGIGIAFDALLRRRETIYERSSASARLRAAPFVAARGLGLRLELGF
jgi:hypothetical protein